MAALDNDEMCVCDLSEVLRMTKSAISHQLKVLKDSGLVKFRRDGKNVFYTLKDDHVKTILEMGIEHIKERD
jgi:ArsR family transcriptional regulator